MGGIIRLDGVRRAYFNGELSFDEVVDIHSRWVNQNEYHVIAYPVLGHNDYKRIPFGDEKKWYCTKHDYWGFLLSKRGNRAYKRRVRKRLGPLLDLLVQFKGYQFFDEKVLYGKTKLLMVTLTYDTKKNPSVRDAWETMGRDYNNFISSLRKKYGKIKILRSWESFENGYPHVHLIVLFQEHGFKVKRFRKKSGKIEYLIPVNDDKVISSYHHSYVKVTGVRSLGAVWYLLKYITKKVFQETGNKTLVTCWLYRNQQYSMSNGFPEALKETLGASPPLLDSLMHYSNQKDEKKVSKRRIRHFPHSVGNVVSLKSTDLFIKLKPPPSNHSGIWDLEREYGTHEAWLRYFAISDMRCGVCGIPLFIEDSKVFEGDNGVLHCLCEECEKDF